MSGAAVQFNHEYYIFDKLWWCRIPFNQSRSVEHIKHFGTPMSGDLARDQQTANELVDRMVTIDKMVGYWKSGVHVYVRNPADCKEIYERISDYLQVWRKHIESSLNIGTAPLQDLVDLDGFANSVYAHAKFQFTNTFVEDTLRRRMGQVLSVSRGELLRPKATPQAEVLDTRTDEEKLAAQYPDREGHATYFERTLQSSSLNRGMVAQAPRIGQLGNNPAPMPSEPGRLSGIADKWK